MKFFKKSVALIAVAGCIAGSAAVFGGCGSNSSDGKDSGSESGNGTTTVTPTDPKQSLRNKISTTPTNYNYIFGGWYADSACTKLLTVNSDLSDVTEVYPKWMLTPQPQTFEVRSETVTITDSGRIYQKMDIVRLSDYYHVKGLNFAGYTKLKVTFTFDVREVNDGYQYVFFYYNSKCKGNDLIDKVVDATGVYDRDDPSWLYTYKFEHGAGKKNTSWSTHTFSTVIDMGMLKDELYVRYGASGSGEDDWQNKNVWVDVEAVKPD